MWPRLLMDHANPDSLSVVPPACLLSTGLCECVNPLITLSASISEATISVARDDCGSRPSLADSVAMLHELVWLRWDLALICSLLPY